MRGAYSVGSVRANNVSDNIRLGVSIEDNTATAIVTDGVRDNPRGRSTGNMYSISAVVPDAVWTRRRLRRYEEPHARMGLLIYMNPVTAVRFDRVVDDLRYAAFIQMDTTP